MKSDWVVWEALEIVWKLFSTLNFGSNVLTDIDTMALKEKKCDKVIVIKPGSCQNTKEIETQGKGLDKIPLHKGGKTLDAGCFGVPQLQLVFLNYVPFFL